MTKERFNRGDEVRFKETWLRKSMGLSEEEIGVIQGSNSLFAPLSYDVHFPKSGKGFICCGEDLELVKPNIENIIKPIKSKDDEDLKGLNVGDEVVFTGVSKTYEDLIGCKGTIVAINPSRCLPFEATFECFTGENSRKTIFCGGESGLYTIEPVGKEVKAVSSNPHYDTSIQPIETMQANMTPEEFLGYLKGNIIKYACRCGRKDEPLKEAKKIKEYAGWLVDALEGKKIDPRVGQ